MPKKLTSSQAHKLSSCSEGFVILFTVLISSIILTIALGITNVAFREVLLAGSAKDAQFAFFSADTGAECALYWDIKHAAFGQTPTTPNCRGGSVTMTASSSPFKFNFDTASGCAVITVDKNDPTITKIESLGYNMDCNVLLITPENPRIVERAIRVTYGVEATPAGPSSSRILFSPSPQESTTASPPAPSEALSAPSLPAPIQ